MRTGSEETNLTGARHSDMLLSVRLDHMNTRVFTDPDGNGWRHGVLAGSGCKACMLACHGLHVGRHGCWLQAISSMCHVAKHQTMNECRCKRSKCWQQRRLCACLQALMP